MKKLIRILVVVIAIAALGGGGYWFYSNKVAAQTTASSASTSGSYTQVVTAATGNLSSSVTVVGQMEAVQQADLSFKYMTNADRLKELKVTAGNTVQAGDVLATIDAADYQQAVDQAQSDLDAAQETLADLQTPATDLQIAQADLKIAQAEQSLAQARADLADLGQTGLADLQTAVKNAQDNLALTELQRQLADHDSLAKSERELQYSIDWYQRKIGELQALVAQGKANLEQKESITDQQDKLAEAQADLASTQAERQLSLRSADATIAKAKVSLKDAQQALADAQAGDQLKLEQAQLDVKSAEVAVAKAKQDRTDLDTGADETDLATAQASVDKKKLVLADAQAALAGTQLVATFDGTILQTHADAGDRIGATTTVVTLANLNKLQVVASVDETTIKRVQAGQTATITFDALPGTTLKGTVGDVPLQGTLSGGVMTYDVPISIQGAENLPLLVGMTANVVIQTGSVENALLVPTLALTKSNGMYYVRVPNTVDPTKGEPETVPVEVGLSDGTYTQILSGLVEGDQVLATVSSNTSNNNFRGGPGIMFGFGR